MTLRKPVLIVDGFSGPGRFGDGETGSPVIISECISRALTKNLKARVAVDALCVEQDPELFLQLQHNLSGFDFVQLREGAFGDYVDEVVQAAKTKTVFLYLDPFTVEGLVWNDLDKIFTQLKTGSSVEILLNFNVMTFIRRGRAALKITGDMPEDVAEELDEDKEVDAKSQAEPTLETLDRIVGGNWWQDVLSAWDTGENWCNRITNDFCMKLRGHFKEVCTHPLRALPSHTVPKYTLVFGSRHSDALRLMNDEMVKSRRVLADLAKPKTPTLFETRTEELVPDMDRVPDIVLANAQSPVTRGNLIATVIRDNFCDFHGTEIRGCIEALLKSGKLESETGKPKINDNVQVWAKK